MGQKGRDTQFSDVNKDEPVVRGFHHHSFATFTLSLASFCCVSVCQFDGITDSFAGTVTLKCYLDDAFRNEVSFVREFPFPAAVV